jgi:hypothetical protein
LPAVEKCLPHEADPEAIEAHADTIDRTFSSINSPNPIWNDAFTSFSKLPIELRLRTWEESLDGPRIVELFHDIGPYGKSQEDSKERVFRSNTPPPTTLHVCEESRQVALKHFKKLGRHGKVSPHVAASNDTLYFPFVLAGEGRFDVFNVIQMDPEVRNSIRFVALDSRWLTGENYCTRLDTLLMGNKFPALEELTLVLHEGGITKADAKVWRQHSAELELTDIVDSELVAKTLKVFEGTKTLLVKEHGVKSLFTLSHTIRVMYLTRGKKYCYPKAL